MKNVSSLAQPHNSLKGSPHIIRELRDPQKRTPIKPIYHHISNSSLKEFDYDHIHRKPLLIPISLIILFISIHLTRGIRLRLY